MIPEDYMDKDPRRIRENSYGKEDLAKFQASIKEFIENYPLYKKKRIELPPTKSQLKVEVAHLYCGICRSNQPYREAIDMDAPRYTVPHPGTGGRRSSYEYAESGIYLADLLCQGCHRLVFYCWFWVYVDWEDNQKSYVEKIGQYPMWLPHIPDDIRIELGADTELYQKALMNMHFSYGIGACAYFRRLLEKYINPLLILLLQLKKEEGAAEEELAPIREAIEAKDFTRKSKFAADICPQSLIVAGINPLKKLHDLLSDSLHNLEEDEAMNIAMQIQKSLLFVIRRLRSKYNEQREYVESMRELNKPRLSGE